MKNKKELRKFFINQRKNLDLKSVEQNSKKIADQISIFLNQNNFQSLFSYMAFKNEPDLKYLHIKFMNQLSISVPKVSKLDGEMEFYLIDKTTKFLTSSYGILEPESNNISPTLPNQSSLILVPCVAIDKRGIRLGYGGGFYDRYLSSFPETKKIGICYSNFYVEELPSEPWDCQLNYLCTENEIMQFQ